MEFAAESLQNLTSALQSLPGIGRKTAERLAYHILRSPLEEALKLADAIREVKETLHPCRVCFNVTEKELCSICEDPSRDRSVLCVVEQPNDLFAIEQSASYRGSYHVLQGAFSPLDGVAPEDLTLSALFGRLKGGEVKEVILATNPNFEGEGTALFLHEKLKEQFPAVQVTRIARGMPSGSQLEHVSKTIVSDALEGRQAMD
jgi:recombination protein RecR